MGVPRDLPVLMGVPLVAEAGVRAGLSALSLVAVQAGLARGLSRLAKRDPPSWSLYGWQVLAAIAGASASNYRSWLHRQAQQRHDLGLSAQVEHARLAGQNDVAMGADSVMDRLWRLGWLPGDDKSAFAVRALAAWKADLARTTTAKAFYLGDVLWRWERRHNQSHVLADDVSLDLAPGDGTLVLSPGQAVTLTEALDNLPLAGRVTVRVLHAGSHQYPSVAQFLTVGDFEVQLPLEREARFLCSTPSRSPW